MNANYVQKVGPTITWSKEMLEEFSAEELLRIGRDMFEAMEDTITYRIKRARERAARG